MSDPQSLSEKLNHDVPITDVEAYRDSVLDNKHFLDLKLHYSGHVISRFLHAPSVRGKSLLEDTEAGHHPEPADHPAEARAKVQGSA